MPMTFLHFQNLVFLMLIIFSSICCRFLSVCAVCTKQLFICLTIKYYIIIVLKASSNSHILLFVCTLYWFFSQYFIKCYQLFNIFQIILQLYLQFLHLSNCSTLQMNFLFVQGSLFGFLIILLTLWCGNDFIVCSVPPILTFHQFLFYNQFLSYFKDITKVQNMEKDQQIHENFQRQEEQIEHQDSDFDQKLPSKQETFQSHLIPYREDQHNDSTISIKVQGNELKGSAFTKYTVYFIIGQDIKGSFKVARRYSEFYQVRKALQRNWPGCFIPGIPDKSYMKNDSQLIIKRQRLLNDFVKKVAKIPYLYDSIEFQDLIRSEQPDLNNKVAKWPKLTLQQIISNYRKNFAELSGKQINQQTNKKLVNFHNFLAKNLQKIQQYKQLAKKLAMSKDKFNKQYNKIIGTNIPDYQHLCVHEFVDGKTELSIYGDPVNNLQKHTNLSKPSQKFNSFWYIYDLFKEEQRDSLAFIESIQAREKMEKKRNSIQIKILENQAFLSNLQAGKTSFTSITWRGNPQQLKQKIKQDIKNYSDQRNNLTILTDIITALITYIEIEKYKTFKQKIYRRILKNISETQELSASNFAEIWMDNQQSLKKIVETPHQ